MPLPGIRTWSGEVPPPETWDLLLLIGDSSDWLQKLAPGPFFDMAIVDPSLTPPEVPGPLSTNIPELVRVLRQLWPLCHQGAEVFVFCDWRAEHCILSGMDPLTRAPLPDPGILRGDCTWLVHHTRFWVRSIRMAGTRFADKRLEHSGLQPSDVVRAYLHTEHWLTHILHLSRSSLNSTSVPAPMVGPGPGARDFPTQRPLSVMDALVRDGCRKDGMVLDLYAGSGVASEAALRLGKKVMLVEKSPSSHLMRWVDARRTAGSRVQIYESGKVFTSAPSGKVDPMDKGKRSRAVPADAVAYSIVQFLTEHPEFTGRSLSDLSVALLPYNDKARGTTLNTAMSRLLHKGIVVRVRGVPKIANREAAQALLQRLPKPKGQVGLRPRHE